MADDAAGHRDQNPETVPPRAHWDAGQHAPVTASAREALLTALDEGWADPRRLHREGRTARLLLDGARESLAAGLGVRTEELHLTGGFELAAQSAVLGVARGRRRVSERVLHSAIEHSAVLAAVRWAVGDAAQRSGPEAASQVSELAVDRLGRIDPDQLHGALTDRKTGFVAVQLANLEVGTVQPLARLKELCRASGTPLVSDLSAAAGSIALPRVDVGFADPTCWGAPPGVGVLTVASGIRWRSPWPGDPDDAAHTPGSPGGAAVPQALAAAVALQGALAGRAEADRARRSVIERLRQRLPALIPQLQVVGDPVGRLPHVLTFSVLYADGEALVEELDLAGFAVGSGSACTASTLQPSHVLAAMGALTHGNVRIALPGDSPAWLLEHQAERFLRVLPEVVHRVRERLGAAGL